MKPLRAVGLLDTGGNHRDEDVVGDEAALVHDLLGTEADIAPGCDLGTEHVAGRNLGDAVPDLKSLGLGPFACARRTPKE